MCARVWRASAGAMDRVASLDGQRGCGCSTATEVLSMADVASTQTRAAAPRNAQRVPHSGRAVCLLGLSGSPTRSAFRGRPTGTAYLLPKYSVLQCQLT